MEDEDVGAEFFNRVCETSMRLREFLCATEKQGCCASGEFEMETNASTA